MYLYYIRKVEGKVFLLGVQLLEAVGTLKYLFRCVTIQMMTGCNSILTGQRKIIYGVTLEEFC